MKDIKFYINEETRSGIYLTEDNMIVTFENGEIVSIVRNPYKDNKLPFVTIPTEGQND